MVDFFHGLLVRVGCRRNFMIDDSEKRNCKLGFELQSSRVIERRCKEIENGARVYIARCKYDINFGRI